MSAAEPRGCPVAYCRGEAGHRDLHDIPPCCVGTPSGSLDPQGVEALMCDDDCQCPDCLDSRDFATGEEDDDDE